MSTITWMDPFLPRLVNDPTFIPLDTVSVLDVGCGKGYLSSILRAVRPVERIVGIDVYQPYLDHADRHGSYNHLFQHDLAEGYLPFGTCEFDLAVCLETVEHLSHAQARTLLGELARVSHHALVTTPTTFFGQGNLDGNDHQEHLCRLTKRDFEREGYTVRGLGPISIPGTRKVLPIESWRWGSLAPSWTRTYAAVRGDSERGGVDGPH